MAINRFIVRPDAVRWHCLRTPEEKIRPYDLYREAGDPSPHHCSRSRNSLTSWGWASYWLSSKADGLAHRLSK